MTGTVNTRDVGGIDAADGRAVRTGRLIRTETPELFTAADVDYAVETVGVTLVVDLRGAAQSPDGSGALGRRVRREVLDFFGPDVPRGDAAAPELMLAGQLDRAGGKLVTFLELLVANTAGATLVHCLTGKDRTGFIVGMTLRVAGVAAEEVLADYLLSGPVHHEMLDRLRAVGKWHENAPSFAREAVSGRGMQAMLETLDARWHSPDDYLAEHGADPTLGDRVRGHLLAG